jgi:hypothetical protein
MTEAIIVSITAIITAALTSVIGPIVVNYFTERKKNKKDLIKESLETNMLVTNKLETILNEHGADRVWISQFHNGGHFYPTGKSIQKFSMGYEIVSPGTTSIQASFQNIPISLFSRSMNHILENDVISISDYKDESIATYGLKYTASEMGCKSAYMFALKTIDNKFIGVVGIDFVKRKRTLDDEEINHLKNETALICGVLTNLLESKKQHD